MDLTHGSSRGTRAEKFGHSAAHLTVMLTSHNIQKAKSKLNNKIIMTMSGDQQQSIVLVDASDTALLVSWPEITSSSSSDPDPITYELQYASDCGDFQTLSSTLKSSQARKKNLQPNTSYTFRVRATGSTADDEWLTHHDPFTTLSAEAESSRMAAPTVEGDGNRAAVIRWTAKGDADGYELQMRENVGGSPWSTVAAKLSNTEVRKKNLDNITGYQFRVRPASSSTSSDGPYSLASAPVVGPTLGWEIKHLFRESEDGVLLKGIKEISLDDALAGKDIILLYASAHWCGPCRQFTPQLANWYRSMKATPAGKNVEVVFLSADHDERSFQQYYATQPWLAVPYDDDAREGLMAHIRVSGIPRLCVLDGRTGRILEDNAVGKPMDINRWRALAK